MAHSKKFNRSNKANKRRMNKTKNKKKRTKNKSNKRNMLRKKFSLKKQKKNKNLRGGSKLHPGTPGPEDSTRQMVSSGKKVSTKKFIPPSPSPSSLSTPLSPAEIQELRALGGKFKDASPELLKQLLEYAKDQNMKAMRQHAENTLDRYRKASKFNLLETHGLTSQTSSPL